MLNSGKNFVHCTTKKNKYSNSCVVRKKNSEQNKKPYPPPPLQVKWSVPYSKLKQKYNFVWRSEIYDDKNNKQGDNKLRTYRLFKDNISLEKYLLILNEDVVNTVIVTAGNFEP